MVGAEKTVGVVEEKSQNRSLGAEESFLRSVLELESSDFESLPSHLEDRTFHDESNLPYKAVGKNWSGHIKDLERLYPSRDVSSNPTQGLPGRAGKPSILGSTAGGSIIGLESGAILSSLVLSGEAMGALMALAGGIAGSSAGYALSKHRHSAILDARRNLNDYRIMDGNQDLSGLISRSDLVRSEGEYVDPETFAADYQDELEVLRTEEDFWQDQNQDSFYPKDMEALVEDYGEEAVELSFVDMEEFEDIEAALEDRNIEDFRRQAEVLQALRSHSVESEQYEGEAYQLEVYQGRDNVLSVQGLTTDLGYGEDVAATKIDYDMERELKERIVGINPSLKHRVKSLF